MKALITLIALASTMTVFASDYSVENVLIPSLQITTQEALIVLFQEITEESFEVTTEQMSARKAMANQIKNDSQEYFQTGTMTLLLKRHVDVVETLNPGLSDEDCVSYLLDYSATVLR